MLKINYLKKKVLNLSFVLIDEAVDDFDSRI